MNEIRIDPVDGGTALQDWRRVHNEIIPTAPLSEEEVRERVHRHRLSVAYRGDVLVGCSTVRPPEGDEAVGTVIARVLPAHRRQGIGATLYAHGLEVVRELGAAAVETIVLESNVDGLRFALSHGFTEVERYLLPGDTIRFVTLRLT